MRHLFAAAALTPLILSSTARAQVGEEPVLGFDRIQQSDIAGGLIPFKEIRRAGMRMFSSPFNKLDGYGDGPMNNINDTTSPGGRPTLQNNGTFLRVNGLDAQTCMECHSVGSFQTVPFTFAVGGVGGSNNNAIFQPRDIDVDDEAGNLFAAFDGRYINPPFLFGSGGVELAGKEMTEDLQRLRIIAIRNPGSVINLVTKGVNFGTISYDAQTEKLDTSNVQGIDHDLVVRPFGRKGEFSSVRGFDLEAMLFHFGMQPEEVVGTDNDSDGDGVVNEVLVGEISALHMFNTNLERPEVRGVTPEAVAGAAVFDSVGCTMCHIPALETRGRTLPYTFPEVEDVPFKNAYYGVNLTTSPAGFTPNGQGGMTVPMFSDLKRHDMGPDLAETFGGELDSQFITPRLWGIADTAPYLHDGRALTLSDAILAHGGEGQTARDNFVALSDDEKVELLTFLRTLRTPLDPAADILD